MDRSVNVRPAVLGGAETVRRVKPAAFGLTFEIHVLSESVRSGPVKRFRGKIMAQIQPTAGRKIDHLGAKYLGRSQGCHDNKQ
jgi:hypothetical protein